MKIGITGMAAKTSLGNTSAECHKALCEAREGIGFHQGFDGSKFNAKRSYEIKDRQPGKDRPFRASEWLRETVRDAIADAGIDPAASRVVAVVGTGLRELRSVEMWHNDGAAIALDKLHFGSAVSEGLSLGIPVYTFCNACSASNFALALAMDLLAAGEADYAIAAGVDSITESMFGLLDRVNPMHPQSLRSLNKARRGVVMGEGAAAVVLARDPATAKAWVKGVGLSCDAYQDTAPHQQGLVAAMRDASERSGVGPAEIDMLFMHGTGTLLNDQVETAAVREYFGARAEGLRVTGIKPAIGHTSGASALVSVIMAAESLRNGMAPPILGLEDPIDETAGMGLLYEPTATAGIRNVQVNAFGFGGVNGVAILSRS